MIRRFYTAFDGSVLITTPARADELLPEMLEALESASKKFYRALDVLKNLRTLDVRLKGDREDGRARFPDWPIILPAIVPTPQFLRCLRRLTFHFLNCGRFHPFVRLEIIEAADFKGAVNSRSHPPWTWVETGVSSSKDFAGNQGLHNISLERTIIQ